MSCALCDAVRCIHHDGDGCTLDECELTLTRAMLDDGTPGEIVACSDYVEEEFMSATDTIRAMLDERGVEHFDSTDGTYWGGSVLARDGSSHAYRFSARESVGGLNVHLLRVTPEQAIEATLGRGECRVDVLNTGDCAGYECSEHIMHCNACGHEFGHVLYNEDGDVWMSEPPNYCPNCGRKVKA